MLQRKYISIGAFSSALLIVLYIGVMGIASGSIKVTIDQFLDMWYWIVLLSIGFGIQSGLYFYIRKRTKGQGKQATGIAATNTGTSSLSMVACCAHHLTEILPLLGLSGAAIFLANYQIPLIIFGIVMNSAGIMYMLRVIKKIS